MLSVFPTPLLMDPFEDAYGWPYHHYTGRTRGVTAREAPDGVLEIEVEAPRFAPSEVSVRADPEHSTVMVEGHRTKADGTADEFRRSLAVPSYEYDHAALTWSAEHGVVRIRVPRARQNAVAVAADRALALPTSGALEAVNGMAWPPAFARTEDADKIEFKAVLPDALAAEHVDVRVRRGGALAVTVRAHAETVRKDTDGHVTYSSSQSSTRSTSLEVPPTTKPDDVKVKLNGHEIVIAVQKHK